MTQTIYSAALIAEALPAVWERDPSAGLSNLGRLQRLVRAALAEMRTLLFELRPAALEATPLEALLDRLGDALAGQVKGQVEHPRRGRHPPVVRHESSSSTASPRRPSTTSPSTRARPQVDVECVADDDGVVCLRIRDDGVGFDPGAVGPDSMGLRIMRERLDEAGASLEIDSAPGRGTTITAVWPGVVVSHRHRQRREHERSATH